MGACRRDNFLLSGARVLVTGGTGNLGRQLVPALRDAGASVVVLSRFPEAAKRLWQHSGIDCIRGDLTDSKSLSQAVKGVDLAFHLASYSPRPDEPDIYEASSHWSVTAEGTHRLIDAAVSAGVSGFFYVSSVKAMGEVAGVDGRAADESTPARPETRYGRAKLEAERAVLQAGLKSGLHVAVLRLPMVYGLGAEGNLYRMVDVIARKRFPPWPRVLNRRSAVHIVDAVDAVMLVATHPRSAGETFLVTDGAEYSTRWIYEQIHLALGWPIPGWSLPLWCWRFAARVGTLGERVTDRPMPLNSTALCKLAGDAWYSSSKIRDTLSFSSRHHLDTEIPRMVRAYLHGLERSASG